MIDSVDYVRERLNKQDEQIAEMRADIKELVALANKGRGAWWISLTLVAAFSSALSWVGGYLAK